MAVAPKDNNWFDIPLPQTKPVSENRPLVLTLKQFNYREEVRTELLRIHMPLSLSYDVRVRKQIQFSSWDELREPNFHTLKHDLIAIKEQDEAIEVFSTALNTRNGNLFSSNFDLLNDNCIVSFSEIRKTGFFESDISPQQAQPITEFDVLWFLSRDVKPVPPFGSEDQEGSDKISTLHLSQRGDIVKLTGIMNRLKPSHMYHVLVCRSYVVKRVRS